MNGGLTSDQMLSEVYQAVIGSADGSGLVHIARANADAITTLQSTVYGASGDRKSSLVYRIGQVEDVLVWFRRIWWLLIGNLVVIALGIPAWLWAVLRSGGG